MMIKFHHKRLLWEEVKNSTFSKSVIDGFALDGEMRTKYFMKDVNL